MLDYITYHARLRAWREANGGGGGGGATAAGGVGAGGGGCRSGAAATVARGGEKAPGEDGAGINNVEEECCCSLQDIRLRGTNITDAGVAHLFALQSVIMLDCSKTSVHCAALAPLQQRHRLRALHPEVGPGGFYTIHIV